MLRVLVLSLLIFHIGNAATISRNDYHSGLELTRPLPRTNETLIGTDSVTIEPRSTVDANGCAVCARKYLVAQQKVNFNQAVLLCNQIGMEIASPISADEETAIENTVKKTAPGEIDLWLGGIRCTGCLSEFIWITSGKPVVYSHFWSTEPNNQGNNENCIELLQNPQSKIYEWNDLDCNRALSFVCQSKCCCNNN